MLLLPFQEEKDATPPPLDEGDIALLKSYGLGPYSKRIKTLEEELKTHQQTVKDLIGIKESDTGLSPPSMWDLVGDKQMMSEEAPLQVARCTKIITPDSNTEDNNNDASGSGLSSMGSTSLSGNKYVINIKQIAKFVVGLGDKVAPTDIEEGMRVGVDRSKYSIQIPLPPKIDPTVSLMTVEDKPDVTYDDVGGAKEAMEKLREVLELPLLHPERFVSLGIDPPKVRTCWEVGMIMERFKDSRLSIFEGSFTLRTSRDGQDAQRSSCGKSNGCLLYPGDWIGAGAEVCWRRSPNGA